MRAGWVARPSPRACVCVPVLLTSVEGASVRAGATFSRARERAFRCVFFSLLFVWNVVDFLCLHVWLFMTLFLLL